MKDMNARLRKGMARYRHKSWSRAGFELLATGIPASFFYALGIAAAGAANYAAMLLLAALTAIFVVRLFIIQHDCGHASFFPSRKANDILGFILGVVTLTPYQCWRRYHAMHHAHSGNLDERGFGDIRTLTVAEYRKLPRVRRALYRAYRHPLVLFGIGPFLFFLVRQRLTYYIPKDWRAERRSVHLTNICLAIIIASIAASGGGARFLLFHAPVSLAASGLGVWLFYVQHQFPESYWRKKEDWSHAHAGLLGASHYDLPAMARWLTANIGLHHIHHLDSSIPSYNLHACFNGHLALHCSRRVTLRQSLSNARLKLWDEDQGVMTGFPSPTIDALTQPESRRPA
jgi:omega-6 fatty acid desaturase (delta-12 desaturase)